MKRNLRSLLLITLLLVIVGIIVGVILSQRDETVDEITGDVSEVKLEIKSDNPDKQSDKGTANLDDSIEDTIVPTFDTVRVSPGKGGVIVGRAEPGSKVTVMENGIALGSVYADTNGEWVLVLEGAMAPGDRELSLIQESEDGRNVKSDQVVVISVPIENGKDPISLAKQKLDGKTVSNLEQEEPEDKVVAILMEKNGTGPSRILQGENLVEGEVLGREEDSVRSIDYDSEGSVTFAGQTEPNATVNIYLDGDYVGSAKANEIGEWRITLKKEVKPGKHILRVDRVDDSGLVLSRIETPISRANPQELLMGEVSVVVQPGNSLWRIARRAYGGGAYYTEIYGANQSKILEPDLIFPGQILTLPVIN